MWKCECDWSIRRSSVLPDLPEPMTKKGRAGSDALSGWPEKGRPRRMRSHSSRSARNVSRWRLFAIIALSFFMSPERARVGPARADTVLPSQAILVSRPPSRIGMEGPYYRSALRVYADALL